jgi:hypothetical protein
MHGHVPSGPQPGGSARVGAATVRNPAAAIAATAANNILRLVVVEAVGATGLRKPLMLTGVAEFFGRDLGMKRGAKS